MHVNFGLLGNDPMSPWFELRKYWDSCSLVLFSFSPFIFMCISYIYSSNLLVPFLPPLSPSSLLLFLTFYLYLCPSVSHLISLSRSAFLSLSVTLSLILSFYILFLTNAEHPDIFVENALTNKTGWSLSLWFSLLIIYLRRQSAWKKKCKCD